MFTALAYLFGVCIFSLSLTLSRLFMYIVVLCVQKDRANLNIFFIIGSYGGSWSQYVFHSSQSYLSSAKPSE